ncbi:hypothetical protein AB205_0208860 [Aquarana catesbeiana]|uniref:26S proteasome regulatory subunit 4 n=1 Tax=Aquarana catesbeiana TaxID=8400 RepID=A0A2G9SFV4_AQUCT|nr:hypothetical protein AB205_0208860 [Aquarana catesbeiana]
MERIKDYLLMEEEFIRNQEQMKPLEEKQEEERSKVDDLRGTPMSVGTLEEIIDDNHAIVSTSVGSEHYVSILSFVDKDLLEPGCSVLLNHKVHAVIGVLMDDTDPLVTVMKVEKAPQETYADIGGLDNQIQEIKVQDCGFPRGSPAPEGLTEPTMKGEDWVCWITTENSAAGKSGTKRSRSPSIAQDPHAEEQGARRDDKFLSKDQEEADVSSSEEPDMESGRIDRKIEFPLPDEKTKRRIFLIHTSRMTLADDVTLDDLIMAKDDLSGADIKAICTEGGLMALRERRMKVTNEDFKKSKENVLYKKQEGTPEGLYL